MRCIGLFFGMILLFFAGIGIILGGVFILKAVLVPNAVPPISF
jgi:hypothetical protein